MRLREEVKQAIISVVESQLGSYPGELRLYGSRVDDTLKGGDIDLVFILEAPQQKAQIPIQAYIIAAEIKKKIGDQKIDFSLIDYPMKADPFWSQALMQSVVLHQQ